MRGASWYCKVITTFVQIDLAACATRSGLINEAPIRLGFSCPRLEHPYIADGFRRNAVLGCEQGRSAHRFGVPFEENGDSLVLSQSGSLALSLGKLLVRIEGDSRKFDASLFNGRVVRWRGSESWGRTAGLVANMKLRGRIWIAV